MNIAKLVQDCNFFQSIEDLDKLDEILPFKLDLIEKIYENNFYFTDAEFLILADQLNYLDCNYLDDILIFIKYLNIPIDSLNTDIQKRYKLVNEHTTFKEESSDHQCYYYIL